MSYLENLLHKLENSDNWPCFNRPDFLGDLNELADNVFKNNTAEGYLSSLLIYHQICEEMIQILIKCSTFYIQLSVFPQRYNERVLKDKMFGQLINELSNCIIDDKILKFIDKSKELNQLRINMVHKITLKDSISDIARQCKKSKKLFEDIELLFKSIYENYFLVFHDYKKNIEDLYETID